MGCSAYASQKANNLTELITDESGLPHCNSMINSALIAPFRSAGPRIPRLMRARHQIPGPAVSPSTVKTSAELLSLGGVPQIFVERNSRMGTRFESPGEIS